MGFFVMVLSAVIGLFLIVLGFSRIKNTKSKLWNVVAILIGIVSVIFAIWLGHPK